jgi:hypothetical protein
MNVYLEISGRRAGKTQRLIDIALQKENSFFYVTNSIATITIRNRIKNEKMNYCNNLIYCYDSINLITRHCVPVPGTNLFFDEFDFFESNFKTQVLNLLNHPLVELQNLYFATTPKYIRKNLEDRNDLLVFLLNLNKGKYFSGVDYTIEKNHIYNETEILGKFLI